MAYKKIRSVRRMVPAALAGVAVWSWRRVRVKLVEPQRGAGRRVGEREPILRGSRP